MDPVLEMIGKGLIVYGPLGIISLVSMLTTLRLYRDLTAERERNRLSEAALSDRLVAKSESFVARYYELVESVARLVDSRQRLDERIERLQLRMKQEG